MEETEAADYWSTSLGHAWAAMLRAHGLNPAGTVLEVGPGFGDKVARGLAALDFRGTAVLVEPNAEAARWAAERYRSLLPRAEVVVVRRPVPEWRPPRGLRVDALVSNHLLDDLILHAALPPRASAGVFSVMRPGAACSRAFVRSWRGLLASPGPLEHVITRVAADFALYVAEVRPRLVLLNQYPSWRHDRRGLGPIYTQALRLMRLLSAELGAACVEATAAPQSPVRWLVRDCGRDAARVTPFPPAPHRAGPPSWRFSR